jgi:glutamate dehydrogenase (NAD(P)+)
VASFPGAEIISLNEFFATDVDVFIPAALEQMIGPEQADKLQCKVLAEGANAPVTPAGERRLLERGIAVLPAVLCNAGGVTVSYFEWKQNRQAETWDPEVVDASLQKQMVRAARRVQAAAERYRCDLRTAAYCAGLEHIGKVYQMRGIFP